MKSRLTPLLGSIKSPWGALFGLILGLAIGSASLYQQHKEIREYESVKRVLHLGDQDVVDYAAHQKEWYEGLKREDELSASISLAALVKIEEGDLEQAKERLRTEISTYYRAHKHDGNSNLLYYITRTAATNAGLSNAIYRKIQ